MLGLSRFTLQVLASGGIIAALVTSCVVRDRTIEQRGAAKVVSASKKRGAQANEINSKVRADARKPGSFDRLLREACRDC